MPLVFFLVCCLVHIDSFGSVCSSFCVSTVPCPSSRLSSLLVISVLFGAWCFFCFCLLFVFCHYCPSSLQSPLIFVNSHSSYIAFSSPLCLLPCTPHDFLLCYLHFPVSLFFLSPVTFTSFLLLLTLILLLTAVHRPSFSLGTHPPSTTSKPSLSQHLSSYLLPLAPHTSTLPNPHSFIHSQHLSHLALFSS